MKIHSILKKVGFLSFCFALMPAGPAQAVELTLQGNLGTAIYTGSGTTSNYLTYGGELGFDYSLLFELGGYFQYSSSVNITMAGGRLNLHPIPMAPIYIGFKVGNWNQNGGNNLQFAPTLGVFFPLVPRVSIGAQADYFVLQNSTANDLSIVGTLKFWL